jgi:hypothetical protein
MSGQAIGEVFRGLPESFELSVAGVGDIKISRAVAQY